MSRKKGNDSHSKPFSGRITKGKGRLQRLFGHEVTMGLMFLDTLQVTGTPCIITYALSDIGPRPETAINMDLK